MKIAILMPFASIARCSASTSSLLSVVNRLDIEFPPLAHEHLALGYDYNSVNGGGNALWWALVGEVFKAAGLSPNGPLSWGSGVSHKSRLVNGSWSTSALPLEVDICRRIENVCFVPIADINHHLSVRVPRFLPGNHPNP